MSMAYKTVKIELVLEVGTYTDSDPDKVLDQWVTEHLGHVGKTDTVHVGEVGDGFGDIEVKHIQVTK